MHDSSIVLIDVQKKVAFLSEACVALSLPEVKKAELALGSDAMLGFGMILKEIAGEVEEEIDILFLGGGE